MKKLKPKRKYVRRVCSMCPKWHPSYCSITCATRLQNHPVCEYGRKLITNETSRRWMAAKRKTKEGGK